ncbi:GNAT family N-acetyltransferase [Chitinimonas lacunae]|uniref:GNAT family N-acetyltransferase n=1 Tax=Chitinimonas lacunae TaxID=1963018 RepID=A0ABV8MPM7_9NEIS
MLIRPAVEADWETLKALRLASLLDSPKAFGLSHAEVAQYGEQQWRQRASGRSGPVYFLAWEGDLPVGMVGGVIDRHDEYQLIAMWVRPESRGTAVASRLVEAVEDHARSLGRHSVVLSVAPDNSRACRFYQRQGFVFGEATESLASHPDVLLRRMERQMPV